MKDETFAYLCPKCKTVNTKDKKYCVKCGHWILDSDFPAKPLNKKEFNEINNINNPSKIKSIIVYSIIGILFLIPSINVKMMISLMAVLYGIINIIYPIKLLSIYKRNTGVIVTVISFIVLCVVTSQLPDTNKNSTLTNTHTITNAVANTITNQQAIINTPEPTPDYLKLTATELDDAYKENEVNADNLYKGKTIKLTGTINSIEKDFFGSMYVNLSNGEKYSWGSVQCYFPKKLEDRVAKLNKGDELTIIGKVDGKIGYVMIKDCRFE